ncbi:hypothetical protein Salat_0884100 [Sesamum alatum]|uniref:Uncharacterized protein n=1 Tax=Sesamum alatum TaxID=300844 RepID=A0AAE1YJ48_9LAMI|nr:hypothetical protein Salat_0884100 [Sesamum alatum]
MGRGAISWASAGSPTQGLNDTDDGDKAGYSDWEVAAICAAVAFDSSDHGKLHSNLPRSILYPPSTIGTELSGGADELHSIQGYMGGQELGIPNGVYIFAGGVEQATIANVPITIQDSGEGNRGEQRSGRAEVRQGTALGELVTVPVGFMAEAGRGRGGRGIGRVSEWVRDVLQQLSKEEAVQLCALAWKFWQHRCCKLMEGKFQNPISAWQEVGHMLDCYETSRRRLGSQVYP